VAEYAYTIVLHPDSDGDGYAVEVPALPGCFTQGSTHEEALVRAQEAIAAHLAGLVADGEPIPVERERPELATVTVSS
jgi:predicted RNase H-like HicB family nuclease